MIYINQIYDYKNDEIYNKIKGIYLYISSFYSKKEEINIFLISKVNDNLNKSIERIKRKNRYLVSGGAVCAIAFVVCLLVK